MGQFFHNFFIKFYRHFLKPKAKYPSNCMEEDTDIVSFYTERERGGEQDCSPKRKEKRTADIFLGNKKIIENFFSSK